MLWVCSVIGKTLSRECVKVLSYDINAPPWMRTRRADPQIKFLFHIYKNPQFKS
ncbi:hypothetical protein RUMHYD_00866 [Blautia hydrogenotrophica DSM 10507]|uniref:Uncharacterized protein n=1 Tax=Blautia hydrogenotrophica (strain DSM 10507 / JCM 14656 / S5a33) TaxID=476272 RepID=C0CJ49_BLAHS|nr:hypothetical protein RUMHYD_00866 [Blautia hydrogenotrophica DSM 10507]